MNFTNSAVMDRAFKYMLYWKLQPETSSIAFAVYVQTKGWFGLGLSPNGGMGGSDIVIGWVDANGQPTLSVRR